MKRKEARAQIAQRLASGERKAAVFDALSGQGVPDKALAWIIAAYADPRRAADNRFHAWVLAGITFLQLVFALLMVMGRWHRSPAVHDWIVLLFTLAWSGLFIHGFIANRAAIYNASLMITALQWFKGGTHAVHGASGPLGSHPAMALFGWFVSFAMFAYVLFVRRRLFPDLTWMWPRKRGGRYVFVD